MKPILLSKKLIISWLVGLLHHQVIIHFEHIKKGVIQLEYTPLLG